jgi:hypothetical protein
MYNIFCKAIVRGTWRLIEVNDGFIPDYVESVRIFYIQYIA